MRYHLGCGSFYLEGYHNVDFPPEEHTVNKDIKVDQYADILTMSMEKCSEIRSSHVFEHFNYYDSLYLLYKWYTALEINGILRINLPDVERLSEALKNASVEKSFRIIRYLYGSHEDSWAYHINGWTEKTLSYVLSNMGFKIISVNRTGDVNNDYPNCSIEITVQKISKMDPKEVLLSVFDSYKNGNTEFENNLADHLQKEFLSRIEMNIT